TSSAIPQMKLTMLLCWVAFMGLLAAGHALCGGQRTNFRGGRQDTSQGTCRATPSALRDEPSPAFGSASARWRHLARARVTDRSTAAERREFFSRSRGPESFRDRRRGLFTVTGSRE